MYLNYYVYLREGTNAKNGLVLVMSRGAAKTGSVNTKKANTVYIDLTGNNAEEITTDSTGVGIFKTPAGKISLWVPKQ